MKYYIWKIMVRTPSMWRNLLVNQELINTWQEITTSRKFWVQFFIINKCHFLITHSLVFCLFPITKVYNGGQYSISSFRCFSYWTKFLNKFKQCVIRGLMQGRFVFSGPKKWDSKSSPFKRLIGGITCKSLKN
jgi:hypothetical protein